MLKKINRFSSDFILNILSSFISIGVTQIVVYPFFAANLTVSDYGLMLTIMGYINVIVTSLGNNLFYSRMLMEKEYKKNDYVGDYQVLLFFSLIISCIIIFLLHKLHYIENIFLFLAILMTIFMIMKSYYLVAYRIDMNYRKDLISSVISSFGCFAGLLIIRKYELGWQYVFIISNFFVLLFIYFTSDIMKEKVLITPLFYRSFKTTSILIISGLIGNVTTYLDRFIIFPILGGDKVTIYSTAVFFSKSLFLIVGPISSVFFNYVINGKMVFSRKKYSVYSLLFIVFGVFSLFITNTVGVLITSMLYPGIYTLAKDYIFFASCGICLGIASSFNSNIVLAYAPTTWQPVISLLKLIMYICLGALLTREYGLEGMCLTTIFVNGIYYLVNYFVGLHYLTVRNTDN